jgi:hypothetical protein
MLKILGDFSGTHEEVSDFYIYEEYPKLPEI